MANEWAKKEEDLLKELKTSRKGLSEKEASERLIKYGKNEIVKTRKIDSLKIFARQFVSFLIIILIIAAFISALLKNWLDFSVIMGIVILNGIFGFVQEYKAEKAIEKLKEMLVPRARVLRDGKVIEIDSREIVPGDILVLSEGDRIMADARILVSESLETNEASLTGESSPVDKKEATLKIDVPLVERSNIVFQGTEIVRGSCQAVVFATGMKTEFGKIAELVQKVEPEKSPFRQKLDIFARKLGIILIGLSVLIVLISFLFQVDRFQIFLTSVALAISGIPEGLPAVITIALALATQRMLKVNVLIRKLPASETLGRVSVICVDKTGTITEEKMTVREIYVNGKTFNKFPKNKEVEMLFKIGILCNNARLEKGDGLEEYYIGDPTEKALIIAGKNYGLDKKAETEIQPRIKEFPFSSERKIMSIVRKYEGTQISYVKGAPEIVIKKCNLELLNGKLVEISEKRREELIEAYKKMAFRGLRVLGFAYKNIIGPFDREKAERNLIFVGLQGMIDPPRPEVKQAIKKCNEAGIRVIMLTGDSALTAENVGEEIGLKGKVIEAAEMEKMSDEELEKEIEYAAIFARISPQDKLRIVTILKRHGEIVAVTGDGANDAPALKKADIGIAVNRGTDVAKDSSDIILLDDNFASIVKAAEEGRRIYDNIKKFIKYMLSTHFDEILLVITSIFLMLPLPFLPLQILWLNLVTDSFPALALSTEYAEKGIMKRKPMKDELLKGISGFIIAAGLIGFAINLIMFLTNLEDIEKARSVTLTTMVVFEMFIVFNCRTNESIFKARSNKNVWLAIMASVTLHLIVLYTPLNVLFSIVPIGLSDWGKLLGLCFVGFLVLEFVKAKVKF